jgi:hypothetical protein
MGFSGAWTVSPSPVLGGVAAVLAGNLSPDSSTPSTGLTTTGNSLSLPPANASRPGGLYRTLSNPIGATGTTSWLSVVMKGDGLNASISQGSISLTNGPDSVTHLFSDGFNITTGTFSNANWSVSGVAGAGPAMTTVSDTLQSLLVARIAFGSTTDTVDLFVNPALGADPPGSSQASITIPHAASLGVVRISMSSLTGTDPTLFDEIRIASTFADVVGVPEPSTLMLVSAVGIAGAFLRRRRARPVADGNRCAVPG